MSGTVTAAGAADLYVDAADPSGPNTYATIQGAVDNATSGDIIQVNATGPYTGTVTVTENVTITSDGATLDGGGSGTAFTINDSLSTVTIEGLSIERYDVAVDGASGSAALTLRNLTVQSISNAQSVAALTANGASGNVTVQNVTVRDSPEKVLDLSQTESATHSVRNLTAINTSTVAGGYFPGNTTYTDLIARNVDGAILLSGLSSGKRVVVENATIDGTAADMPGVDASHVDGQVIVSNSTFRDVPYAVAADTAPEIDATTGNVYHDTTNPCNGDEPSDENGDGTVDCGIHRVGDVGSSGIARLNVDAELGNDTTGTPYATIQGAVNDSDSGVTTVAVNATGPYRENVTVDKNITVTSDGATLNGSAFSGGTAFNVTAGQAAIIEGFRVEHYVEGIDATDAARLVVENTTLSGKDAGVIAQRTDTVRLHNVSMDGYTRYGLYGDSAVENVTVTETVVTNSNYAIYGGSSAANWTLRNVTLRNNERGIRAGYGTSNWTVRNATITNSGTNGAVFHNINSGRIVDSTITRSGGIGIGIASMSGNWTVRNTTFRNNTDYDIDAQGNTYEVNASAGNLYADTLNPCNGDQAGDPNGDGEVDCGLTAASDPGTSGDLDLRVNNATGNDADPTVPYKTIQAAVNGADGGVTEIVQVAATGPYTEQVSVDHNLTITSDGATLNGSTTGTSDVALSVETNTSVQFEGFHVREYQTGVNAASKGSVLTIRDMTAFNITKFTVALDGRGHAAIIDSYFERVRDGVRNDALVIAGAKDVTISNLTVVDANTGVVSAFSGGDVVIRNSTFLNASAHSGTSEHVLDFVSSKGQITITDTYVSGGETGLTLNDATGSTTIRNLTLRNLTNYGINAYNAYGPHQWENIDIRNVSTGIFLVHNRNGVTARNLSIRNANVGIHDMSIYGDNGGPVMDLSVNGLHITNTSVALDADEVNTNATYANTVIRNSDYGILANASTNDWWLRNVTVAGTDSPGLDATGASGNWTIRDSTFSHTGSSGLLAADVSGNWSVRHSAFRNNARYGIAAPGALPWVNASIDTAFAGNALGSCYGNVTCGAENIIVNATASNDGRSPYTTLSAGLDAAGDNDTVFVRPTGPYTEAITISDSVTIEGSGAVLNGTGIAGPGITITDGASPTIRNLTVTGFGGAGVDASGTTGSILLDGATLQGNGGDGLLAASASGNVTAIDTAFRGNGGYGVNATDASQTVIAALRTVFTGNQLGACTGNVDCGGAASTSSSGSDSSSDSNDVSDTSTNSISTATPTATTTRTATATTTATTTQSPTTSTSTDGGETTTQTNETVTETTRPTTTQQSEDAGTKSTALGAGMLLLAVLLLAIVRRRREDEE